MRAAIGETDRRRAKQLRYNQEHGIEPASIVKAVRDLTDQVALHAVGETRGEYRVLAPAHLPKDELSRLIKELEREMRAAAEALEFEKAAALRDQIFEFRQTLAEMENLPPWQRVRQLAGEEPRREPEL